MGPPCALGIVDRAATGAGFWGGPVSGGWVFCWETKSCKVGNINRPHCYCSWYHVWWKLQQKVQVEVQVLYGYQHLCRISVARLLTIAFFLNLFIWGRVCINYVPSIGQHSMEPPTIQGCASWLFCMESPTILYVWWESFAARGL